MNFWGKERERKREEKEIIGEGFWVEGNQLHRWITREHRLPNCFDSLYNQLHRVLFFPFKSWGFRFRGKRAHAREWQDWGLWGVESGGGGGDWWGLDECLKKERAIDVLDRGWGGRWGLEMGEWVEESKWIKSKTQKSTPTYKPPPLIYLCILPATPPQPSPVVWLAHPKQRTTSENHEVSPRETSAGVAFRVMVRETGCVSCFGGGGVGYWEWGELDGAR